MRLMATFFRAYPLHTGLMLAALLLSGIAEGIGLSALLPLLNIGLGADAGAELVAPETEIQSNLERVVFETLDTLGIAVTLGNLLLIIVGGAALKAAPSYMEFLSIKSAVQAAGKEGTVRDIRKAFDRISVIDNISSITSKDLTIEKNDAGGHSVKFQYEKQIPLAGPVSLLIDYAGAAE